jgi:hypothetical protein
MVARGSKRPHRLTERQIRKLKADQAQGKHLGFYNVRNLIYTNALQRHTPDVAVRIAQKKAGMISVSKGITRKTRRDTIPII